MSYSSNRLVELEAKDENEQYTEYEQEVDEEPTPEDKEFIVEDGEHLDDSDTDARVQYARENNKYDTSTIKTWGSFSHMSDEDCEEEEEYDFSYNPDDYRELPEEKTERQLLQEERAALKKKSMKEKPKQRKFVIDSSSEDDEEVLEADTEDSDSEEDFDSEEAGQSVSKVYEEVLEADEEEDSDSEEAGQSVLKVNEADLNYKLNISKKILDNTNDKTFPQQHKSIIQFLLNEQKQGSPYRKYFKHVYTTYVGFFTKNEWDQIMNCENLPFKTKQAFIKRLDERVKLTTPISNSIFSPVREHLMYCEKKNDDSSEQAVQSNKSKKNMILTSDPVELTRKQKGIKYIADIINKYLLENHTFPENHKFINDILRKGKDGATYPEVFMEIYNKYTRLFSREDWDKVINCDNLSEKTNDKFIEKIDKKKSENENNLLLKLLYNAALRHVESCNQKIVAEKIKSQQMSYAWEKIAINGQPKLPFSEKHELFVKRLKSRARGRTYQDFFKFLYNSYTGLFNEEDWSRVKNCVNLSIEEIDSFLDRLKQNQTENKILHYLYNSVYIHLSQCKDNLLSSNTIETVGINSWMDDESFDEHSADEHSADEDSADEDSDDEDSGDEDSSDEDYYSLFKNKIKRRGKKNDSDSQSGNRELSKDEEDFSSFQNKVERLRTKNDGNIKSFIEERLNEQLKKNKKTLKRNVKDIRKINRKTSRKSSVLCPAKDVQSQTKCTIEKQHPKKHHPDLIAYIKHAKHLGIREPICCILVDNTYAISIDKDLREELVMKVLKAAEGDRFRPKPEEALERRQNLQSAYEILSKYQNVEFLAAVILIYDIIESEVLKNKLEKEIFNFIVIAPKLQIQEIPKPSNPIHSSTFQRAETLLRLQEHDTVFYLADVQNTLHRSMVDKKVPNTLNEMLFLDRIKSMDITFVTNLDKLYQFALKVRRKIKSQKREQKLVGAFRRMRKYNKRNIKRNPLTQGELDKIINDFTSVYKDNPKFDTFIRESFPQIQ